MEMNEMKLNTTSDRMKKVSFEAGCFAADIGSPVEWGTVREMR